MTERHTTGLPVERDLPAVRRNVRKDHLMTEFTDHPPRRRPSRGLRRLTAVVAAFALAGGGFGVAAASGLITVGGAGDTTSVQCYDRPSLEGNTTIADRTSRSPVAICRDLWRQGIVRHGSRTPPRLVGCIMKDRGEPGQVAVFPGVRATCASLGLAPAEPPTREERVYAAKVRGVQDDLERAITGDDRCVPERRLARAARSSLDRHGLSGWTVRNDFGPGDRCASFGLDQSTRTVSIVGEPR